mmetsp:Transcript_28079/g.74089  ORF Transcript_28079/g.74089 Transcript_28079/m.74089 type:complete len:193 (+) Transcript_28079:875-1453(+)
MKIEHPLLPLPRLPDQLTYSPFPIVLPHRFPSPFHLTPPPPCPRVGRKLGLNYDFKCDTTPIAPDGGFHLSQGPFRSAPVWPNYLIDLEKNRMTPGCTKFVPRRRFVDFVSRSTGALQARADCPANQRAHTKYFANTSRAAAPADAPFHMKVAYEGAGTAYSHFNTLGRKEWEKWHVDGLRPTPASPLAGPA